ncbi:hypothetical protein [Streptomyces spinosus]|uniref:hypothetical protein n=1 Tax=Streptomyces spinosus TaxID=2872623 RepID=UPI001CEC1970|nr:hypothetical protein [Streptomyces spinosus]
MSPHDIEQRLIGVAWAYVSFAALTIAVFIAVFVCHVVSDWRARRHDLGPDRLWEEVDAHLTEVIAADPQLAAGLDRLLNDVSKGEQ